MIEPTIRIAVIEGAETAGHSKFLVVKFTEHGNPTSVRELGHFAETWAGVKEWHKRMMEGEKRVPLDEFMEEKLVHKASVMFASAQPAARA